MDELLNRTIEIISSHIANNSVSVAELPVLIQAVHSSLVSIVNGKTEQVEQPKAEPAVPVKKSVHHDYLVSLEDGKRYQTLKRHLSALGITPDEYRAKWGLAADYPMTAQGYSERRSALAKSLGLGRKPAEPVEPPASVKKARAKPKAQVEAEAPAMAAESTDEPAAIVQEADDTIQEADDTIQEAA